MSLADSPADAEVLRTRRPAYGIPSRAGLRLIDSRGTEPDDAATLLCIPLAYKGWCEGVVHVHLGRRGPFDWYELNLLQALVAQATATVVGTRLHQEAMQAAELRRHMQMAGAVQRQMIPRVLPRRAGLEVAAVHEPAGELSGDFYDFIEQKGGRLGVVICDVVGKGARASLLMASIRGSLRALATQGRSAARVLEGVNRDLAGQTASGDFATLFYGVFDGRRSRLTYANAGHCPPLLVRNGRARRLLTGGMVLGIDPDAPVPTRSLALRSGDVLLAYTDGLTEAADFHGEQFGEARLRRSLRTAADAGWPAELIARQVRWEVRRFVGLQPQADDLTILAIKAT